MTDDNHSPGPRRAAKLRFDTARLGGLLLLLCVLPSCGYTLGGLYRRDVATVHVPMFKLDGTFRRGVEFQLTEAVQKAIQNQTDFRLASERDADTQLVGRIVGINKRTLGEDGNDEVRESQYELAVRVSWVDRRNQRSYIREKDVPIPPDVVPLFSQSAFAPELGQSMATARQRAVDNLARQIVQLMQTPW
ncbi:MAG: LPS assembly lipoprotein LptE [Planctomycetaceae bacterium]